MSAQGLNQKYTVDHYATKNEVAKGLGTSLIDPFWNEILKYRERFSRPLPIFDITGVYYSLVHIDSVDHKQIEINNALNRLTGLYDDLIEGSMAKKTLINEMLKTSLKEISKLHELDASEITLTNIISGQPVSDEHQILVRYLKALETFKYHTNVEVNEDFLAEYYAILRGEEELSCFYRLSDNYSFAAKSLIDRAYDNGVPNKYIEGMMGTLLSYLNDRNASIVTKISLIFYIFNYVKPFDDYNEELACLVAKSVLAKEGLGIGAAYTPIESFLLNAKFFGDTTKEVQKSHDFTYAYLIGSSLIQESLDVILDRIVQLNGKTIENSIKFGESKKDFEKEFGFTPESDSIDETPKAPKVVTPKQTTKPKIHREQVSETQSYESLSDKELKAKEEDMLESCPFLKKGQAHFYVHHCAKGKFYTIQQYKKFIGCVYETARTSMDNLASQGYYRREQIKNKFVYTPIDKE